MTKTYSQAYHTGFESHEQGEARTANPYAADTWESGEWFRGWDGESGEHFSPDHIHTTPDGRHFRHGDGVEVDGDGNEIVVNENGAYRTEEYQISDEDRVVIEWDGESRTIRTYTRGTDGALYAGDSLDAAAESLGIDREAMDAALLASDPIVRDSDGNEIDR